MKSRYVLLAILTVLLLVPTFAAAKTSSTASQVTPPDACAFNAQLKEWLAHNSPNGSRERNLETDLQAFIADLNQFCATSTTTTSTTTTTTVTTTTTTTAPTTTTTAPTTTTTAPPGGCTTHNGNLTVNTPGTVVANTCIVNGSLICNAANVTLRDSSINIRTSWAIVANQGCSGFRAARVNIDCNHVPGTSGFAQDNGRVGQDIELRNLDVRGCENGVFIDNGVKLFDSYIHDPLNDSLSGAHSDGVQLWAGASDVVVQGNTIDYRGNTTSAMISGGFEPDPNFGFSSDILVTGNVLGGGAATLYVPAKEDCCGEAATHVYDTIRVTNNRFMQEHAFFFCDGDETRLGEWSGNTVLETGVPLTTCD